MVIGPLLTRILVLLLKSETTTVLTPRLISSIGKNRGREGEGGGVMNPGCTAGRELERVLCFLFQGFGTMGGLGWHPRLDERVLDVAVISCIMSRTYTYNTNIQAVDSGRAVHTTA